MDLNKVLLLTGLLGISACATSVYDNETTDEKVQQQAEEDIRDPMIENNERLIKEGREDEWKKNIRKNN
jgi:hypothetical protein